MTSPHRADHAGLLSAFTPQAARAVEAVVVPTARGTDHLRTAAEVAAELEAPLIAFCSGDSVAAEVGHVLADVRGLEVHAVDIDVTGKHRWLPQFARASGQGGRISLSRKRNIGLLVAHMAGWRSVLFLDDDIRDINADTVRIAASGLGPGAAAVGLEVTQFPDHSAVCHANRITGGGQQPFVSGSALLVDLDGAEFDHFPTIYNEDWLYLFDALSAGRVSRTGEVRQIRYDPFTNPGRARQEEFGEVIAEGLVDHLHAGGKSVPLDRAFWGGFLRRRSTFISDVRARVIRSPAIPGPRRIVALESLDAAAQRLREITPGDCTTFLRSWQADRRQWRRTIAELPDLDSDPAAALSTVGVGVVHSTGARTWHRRPRTSRIPLASEVRPASNPVGTALIVPGFLDGRRNAAHVRLAAALPPAGWNSVSFDPRGTASRPDVPLSTGPTEHLADIASLLRKHAPGVRAVIGHSYGAWLALLHAAIDPRVTHVVAVMPTRCFLWADDYTPGQDRWSRHGERVFHPPVPGSDILKTVRVSHAVVDDARGYDLPHELATLTTPVLFLAGDDDRVVPPDAVERLYKECGSADSTFHVLEDVRHDYRDNPAMIEKVTQAIIEWLSERSTSPSAGQVNGSAMAVPEHTTAPRSD